ncbi:MAG: DJ-1/PfpI family protein [candidate division Zixibacteria bacterium]|nr:DJ-1/PfpI family protein [candidate division Zixibacteria bacterium]
MKRVLLILPAGFELYEASVFADVFGWADTYGSERIELISAGLRPRLHCTFGFDVIPDAQLDEVDVRTFDALAIPGGFERAGFYEDAYSDNVLDTIREFAKLDKPIASICVGSLPLAKSGILDQRRATTYHLGGGKRRKQLAELGADVVDEMLVCDGEIITSTSPATAIEVALLLLEKLTSRENAEKIKGLMGF